MKEEPAHQHFALLVCLLWLFSVISRSVLRGLFLVNHHSCPSLVARVVQTD